MNKRIGVLKENAELDARARDGNKKRIQILEHELIENTETKEHEARLRAEAEDCRDG